MWFEIRRAQLILFCLVASGWLSNGKSIGKEDRSTQIATDIQDRVKKSDGVIEVTYEDSTSSSGLEDATATTPLKILELFDTVSPHAQNINLLNESSEFRPSVHLGEITQSRSKVFPFNRVHHMNFESSSDPKQYQGTLYTLETIPHYSLQHFVQGSQNGLQIPQNVSQEAEDSKVVQYTGRVKFEGTPAYVLENAGVRYGGVTKYHQVEVKPVMETTSPHYEVIEHQQVYQNLENPVFGNGAVSGKQVNFPPGKQNYDFSSSAGLSSSSSPYQTVQDYSHYQPLIQEYQVGKKPESNVVYVHQQESSFTRTQKFPYPLYTSPSGYQELAFFNDHHLMPYFKKHRISPWKKLIHLLVAFLPLGLLLASLTPNVVKIDNTTQPNIVLSKLRVADLPMEHKHARLTVDKVKDCEERSMCQMILAGGQTKANLLQNLLWGIASRTSEKIAKENGLEEIFKAAKKKDCSTIIC